MDRAVEGRKGDTTLTMALPVGRRMRIEKSLLMLLVLFNIVAVNAGLLDGFLRPDVDPRLKTGWKLTPKEDIPLSPFATLYFEDIVEGTGKSAAPGDAIETHYTGRLISGKKFDSSLDRGQTFGFTLGNNEVIQGWDVGIAGDIDGKIPPMKVGGTRQLYIPFKLAYGVPGMGGTIPRKADLVFQVELVSVESAVGAANMRPRTRGRLYSALPSTVGPNAQGVTDSVQAALIGLLPYEGFRWFLHKLLSLFLLCTCSAHFGRASSLRLADMVPGWMGDRGKRRTIVTYVGVAQLVLSVLLQVRGSIAQTLAGLGIFTMFIVLFPANVHDLVDGIKKKNESLPTVSSTSSPSKSSNMSGAAVADGDATASTQMYEFDVNDVYKTMRLPLQAILLVWAYVCSPGLSGNLVDPWSYYSRR